MHTIGIIAEYNPFHNGHKYQIDKIKKLYPESMIVVVMSSSFTQRGEASLMDKWKKTEVALENGCDLIVELPFIFSTQSADEFAHGAIQILKELQVDTIVFGSESNDVEKLIEVAKIQLNNKEYNSFIKKYLDKGLNYPTSMNKALKELIGVEISSPNDLLGLSYIKEIIKQKADILPLSIKRTNDFNNKDLTGIISSATSIRESLKNKIDIKKQVPISCYRYLHSYILTEDYFPLLKYKILATDDLSVYLDVDEGIEHRIKKEIIHSTSLDQFIKKIKSKRYTYNKISRMLIHILCDFTKKKKLANQDIRYVRVLGFNNLGKHHLNKIKKQITVPLITTYNSILDEEYKITCIYASVLEEEKKNELIQNEYKNHPIIKK